ncbi:carboxylesterase/lipase family protein [Aurantivibrio plasticivorans]
MKGNKSQLALWLASMFLATSVIAQLPQTTPVVETNLGKVQGFVHNDIDTFKGIRYGAAPVGDLRFMPPQKPEPIEALYNAIDYGAPAMQAAAGSLAFHRNDYSLRMQALMPTFSEMKIDNEDCLFLNVWTPEPDNNKRPVMVWFHGGGHAFGSGNWPLYNGENLAKRGDVVVVTVNHRLNVFGYLHLAELLGKDYATSGNAGNLDMVLALEWVRDNIANFGGDPSNVTIMGESGGGQKVSNLMAMPSAQGLFHKAIIQSGPGITVTPSKSATATATALLAELGINDAQKDLKTLQGLSADTIMAAALKVGSGKFSPVLDGISMPQHPFIMGAPKISADVPVLIGTNKDELTFFQASEPWFGNLTEEQLEEYAANTRKGKALLAEFRRIYPDYSPTHLRTAIDSAMFHYGSQMLAERKAAQNAAKVYMYSLTWETPANNGKFRSAHTLEIPFMFDNVELSRILVGPGDEPQAMADQMSEAWIAFARTGNPNNKNIPEWPAFDAETRSTMMFNLPSKVENDPLSAIRKILSGKEG